MKKLIMIWILSLLMAGFTFAGFGLDGGAVSPESVTSDTFIVGVHILPDANGADLGTAGIPFDSTFTVYANIGGFLFQGSDTSGQYIHYNFENLMGVIFGQGSDIETRCTIIDTLGMINAPALRLRYSEPPDSADASGIQGDIAWDASYIYVCISNNTWKRSSLSTW